MSADRVIISGASGLIGRALTASLRADGYEVTNLVRRAPANNQEIRWLDAEHPLSPDTLAGAKAVVNLNGANIGRLPWMPGYRETLRASRLGPTRVLTGALRQLGADAPAFLSASGISFYGDRPGEALDEQSTAGDSFLARLCVQWEGAALRAADTTRTVLLRTAPVLHPEGVLRPMITLTRLGAGGPLGSGQQLWPWISLEDEIGAIRHAIDHDVHGPVNLTGPTRATASDIGRALARTLHRPFLLPAPAWALRLALGRDAADSLILADLDAAPAVLQSSGYQFQHPTAEEAVRSALG